MVWYGMVWYGMDWSEADSPPRVRPRAIPAWWTLSSAQRGSADLGTIPSAREAGSPSRDCGRV